MTDINNEMSEKEAVEQSCTAETDLSAEVEGQEADKLSAEATPEAVDWEQKYNELNDTYLRLHAEFDNFRKRTLKEKAELLRSGSERVLGGILPVVDDFERALQNLQSSSDAEAIKEGIDLIYNKFLSFLNKNGVQPMETNGQPFDAEQHEAITMIPAPSEEMKNIIIDTVEKGYTLDGKVMRFPKVVVGQ